jgi:PAS domain S-box-containing protein
VVAADDGRRPPAVPDGAVFSADPEVGRDLAQVDWAATPLGSPDLWPQSLQTAVRILLSSRFSMWMAWGPELTFFCNAAYRRDTLGAKYPWALGRPASDVWAEIWDDIGPRIERVLSTGEATWDSALLLFLERSGYTEESYHTFSYSPLYDDAGEVVGFLCVVSEDTDRVISERRMATLRELGSDHNLQPSEERSLESAASLLSANLRDLPFTMTYLFNDDGSAQLAAVSGITAGHRVAPQALAEGSSSVWPLAAASRGESVIVDLDGEPFSGLPTGSWPDPPARALVVPLIQQGAAPYGFLVAGLNRYRPLNVKHRGFIELVAAHLAAKIGSARSYRAEQRRAEELAELDRAKTDFFSNISHEFRTPLTLMLGPLSELRARSEGVDESMRQELDVAHRNGLRLAKLVNTLLDFSRLEAGRMQARYVPTELSGVTVELTSVFRSAVDKAGLTFEVDCPPLDEPVYLDRDMWEKVVLNLLSNALKFTFDGSIAVRVRREGAHAAVSVSDTGIGVPAAEMPRLFERFHRIETARARSNEGSGIGLALVKELVELHGGSIAAESVEGSGTTFTVRLPFGTAHLPAEDLDSGGPSGAGPATSEPYVQEVLQWLRAEDEATALDAAVTPRSTGRARARVLVADDNADMREYLTRLLRTAGYDVDVVTDGRQALERVRTDLPDLVVSDVMMPRMDGLELVAALRTDPRTAAVPVLLLSARAGQEASIEGLHAGADDYLVKPFAAAELLARVRANVELARLRNHHARWRTALVDSLQEAFFVCDERGAVIEINAAFADILGYGVDGLPYEPIHPWWPDADTDPDAHRQTAAAFTELLAGPQGTVTAPATHRDGHRLWINVTFNHVDDPDTGRHVMVGTFRDITAERYVAQRQTSLAELNQALAQADTADEALRTSTEVLRGVWQSRRVLAVTFPVQDTATDEPDVLCVGEQTQWTDLPSSTRRAIEVLRDGELLTATTELGSAGIALQHPRGVLVVWLELTAQRPFIPEDQTLLTVLAGRLGQGLQRVHHHDQQRETALALQHAILGPSELPGGFAVRYQPASRPLQVGGDWYDLVDLDDGRMGLIVGDCVGHGLGAATVMGQLRSACRALLLENPSPRAALSGLDRFAARLVGAPCTTAFCAVLDPNTGELTYSSAGHPPPILVHADGTARTLDDGRDIPLGLRTDRDRPEARVIMPARATLLLYTDGLVERRGESLDIGISNAADLVQDGSASALDSLASDVMSRLAPDGGYQDDVALLLYRQPAPLQLDFPAETSQLASTRNALRGWLNRAGVDPEKSLDVLIAAGEAIANSIEHGHRDRPGTVTLRASALVDRVHLTVVDSGDWKVPQPDKDVSRGRGVLLMRALMHDVTIDRDAAGTTINMYARID